MITLPSTTCPSCWQRKDDPAKHYCTPCTEEHNRADEAGDHINGACDDFKCRLCFDQDDDGDRDMPETDEDYDEPYGGRDFRQDVGEL